MCVVIGLEIWQVHEMTYDKECIVGSEQMHSFFRNKYLCTLNWSACHDVN